MRPTRPIDITWVQAEPGSRGLPGASYGTDGAYVFERTVDAEGRAHYRRAPWTRVLQDVEFRDLPDGIWEPIDEMGEPLTARS
jgi:hypothetical protein